MIKTIILIFLGLLLSFLHYIYVNNLRFKQGSSFANMLIVYSHMKFSSKKNLFLSAIVGFMYSIFIVNHAF